MFICSDELGQRGTKDYLCCHRDFLTTEPHDVVELVVVLFILFIMLINQMEQTNTFEGEVCILVNIVLLVFMVNRLSLPCLIHDDSYCWKTMLIHLIQEPCKRTFGRSNKKYGFNAGLGLLKKR